MMKHLAKLTIGLALILGSAARAADTCAVCDQIQKLLKDVDASHLECDPLNGDTRDAQLQFLNEARVILQKNLNEKSFNAASAKDIVKLIARALPCDNGLEEMINPTASQFEKLYFAHNGLLKTTLEQLTTDDPKKPTISRDLQHDILDWYGVLNRANHARNEKKSVHLREPARVKND